MKPRDAALNYVNRKKRNLGKVTARGVIRAALKVMDRDRICDKNRDDIIDEIVEIVNDLVPDYRVRISPKQYIVLEIASLRREYTSQSLPRNNSPLQED